MSNTIEEINGKKIVSSSSMGLSSKQFVELKTATQIKSIKRNEDEIILTSKKDESYDEYLSLVLELKNAADSLRNPIKVYSGSSSVTDAFSQRTDSSSCSGCSNDISSYLSMQLLENAPIGVFTLNIQNLAVAASMTSNSFPDSSTTNVVDGGNGNFTAGTFYIVNNNSGTPPQPIPITLQPGTTLINVKATINSQTSKTGVASNIIYVSRNEVKLQLTSLLTGTENSFSLYDPNGVLSNISWPQITKAVDANIIFNNIPIKRSTNSINDLFGLNSELSINLLKANSAEDVITINITPNNDKLAEAIKNFIKSYNDLNEFHAKHKITKNKMVNVGNKRIKVEEFEKNAVLGKDKLFSNSVLEIKTILSGIVSGLNPGSLQSLGEIGLKFIEKDHTFEIESEESNEKIFHKTKIQSVLGTTDNYSQLLKILNSNTEELRKVLQMDFNPSSTNLKIASRSNDLKLTEFTVDININRPSISLTDANGNVQNMQDTVRIISNGIQLPAGSVNYDANTKLITGLEKTPIQGLNMLYTGNGVEIIDVKLSQGIADKIYNFLNELSRSKPTKIEKRINGLRQYDPLTGNAVYVTDETLGPIKALQGQFSRDIKQLSEKSGELNEKLSTRTEQLLREFSHTEAKIKAFEEKVAQIRRQEEVLNRRN